MASVGRSRAGCATARGSPKPREHTFKNQSPSGKAWVHSIPVSAQIMPSCSWSSLGAAPGAEHSGDTGCVFWDQGNGAQAHPHCSLKSPGKDNPPSAPAANHRHAAEAHPWASPTAREKAPSQCLQAGHTPFTSDSCCHYEPGRIKPAQLCEAARAPSCCAVPFAPEGFADNSTCHHGKNAAWVEPGGRQTTR